jgi:glucokinase
MYNIGIDLGGTNIAAAIVTNQGEIVIKDSCKTLRGRAYKEIVSDMYRLCLGLLEKASITKEDIRSVGIGSPGLVDNNNGEVIWSAGMGFEHAPIATCFREFWDVPVIMDNDANAATLAEYKFGCGKEYDEFVMITLGTGIGGGIVSKGELVRGSYNGGAEVGHMSIDINGKSCRCGNVGCWQQYASATALIEMATEAAKLNPESLMNKMMMDEAMDGTNNHGKKMNDEIRMNGKIPFEAAKLGDEAAEKVVEEYIRYLVVGINNIENILQPECIAIGGGISAQGEYLVQRINEVRSRSSYANKSGNEVVIRMAELGNDAGIIGLC